MSQRMKIDFVSDVVCPWCVIGLRALEIALHRLDDAVNATITFHPFELNPTMPAQGQNIVEHIAQKYGATPAQAAVSRETIRQRAAEVRFTISMTDESRIYNTFDAHRLLHWAETKGRQRELKHSLFKAYFAKARSPSDPDVLVTAAGEASLDPKAAADVLSSGGYADDVREQERFWLAQGISGVPAVGINDKYLISGGQPPEIFERAMRQITEKERKSS